jgi:hypothetical protein
MISLKQIGRSIVIGSAIASVFLSQLVFAQTKITLIPGYYFHEISGYLLIFESKDNYCVRIVNNKGHHMASLRRDLKDKNIYKITGSKSTINQKSTDTLLLDNRKEYIYDQSLSLHDKIKENFWLGTEEKACLNSKGLYHQKRKRDFFE